MTDKIQRYSVEMDVGVCPTAVASKDDSGHWVYYEDHLKAMEDEGKRYRAARKLLSMRGEALEAQAKEIERLGEYIKVADFMIEKGLKVDDLKMGDWPKQLEMQKQELTK